MVKCMNCGHDNIEMAKFCRSCGSPISLTSAYILNCTINGIKNIS
ncbi:zinc-ribbon domain-containing protein [Methanobrevibacter curvatus]|uniref:Zinc-ribbon domain-containing protein n=1 Tax=Methanobrevibacter curvatus TaxID=49547 RepID=A0A166DJ83_9EURY|nr:zinc-ribbon domain-containing protein [Methanobrevibacter curvatus]KZX15655.1 hypothetical protein MBCUR_02080 [Methanobrevibacter curvatus]